ncbi:MAG: hypothetical protein QGD92_09975 [Gammaproteobacteria bacterium]|nr:hypothetical protein [Gammaproteobacteria bacterium]
MRCLADARKAAQHPVPFAVSVELPIKEILIDQPGYPFKISLSYHDELERADNGKFEDFVSLIRLAKILQTIARQR